MTSLAGRQPNQTYATLVRVENSGAGIDGTYRDVESGTGTVAGVQLSTAGLKIPSSKTLEIAGTIALASASWTGKVPIANGGTFAATAGSALTNLGAQPVDADLTAIAALTSAADKLPYATGAQTWAVTTFTAYARTLLDDADATAARVTLGLVIGTNVQAFDADLAALAGLTSAADKVPYFTGSGTAAVADFTAGARTFVAQADLTATTSAEGLVEKATAAEVAAQTADKFPDSADLKHHPGVAKAIATVTVAGGTPTLNTTHSYNITSVTDAGTGLLTITIANDFSTADWCCNATVRGANDLFPSVVSIAAGSCQIACADDAGNATDPGAYYMSGFGVLA